MKDIGKSADGALKKAVRLMSIRIENAAKNEKNSLAEDGGKGKAGVKNDELIKFAEFMLRLKERFEKEGQSKEAKEEGEIRFVLDEDVRKWAR